MTNEKDKTVDDVKKNTDNAKALKKKAKTVDEAKIVEEKEEDLDKENLDKENLDKEKIVKEKETDENSKEEKTVEEKDSDENLKDEKIVKEKETDEDSKDEKIVKEKEEDLDKEKIVEEKDKNLENAKIVKEKEEEFSDLSLQEKIKDKAQEIVKEIGTQYEKVKEVIQDKVKDMTQKVDAQYEKLMNNEEEIVVPKNKDEIMLRTQLKAIFDKFNTNDSTKGPTWMKNLSFPSELNFFTNSEEYLSIPEFANLVDKLDEEDMMSEQVRKFELVVKALNFKGRGLNKNALIDLMLILKDFLKTLKFKNESELRAELAKALDKYDDGLNLLGLELTKGRLREGEFEELIAQNVKDVNEHNLQSAIKALDFNSMVVFGLGMDPKAFIELMMMVDRLFKFMEK